MTGFRVWSDYWKKYATEAELHMDGSVDAVFEDANGVPHHDNANLIIEFNTGLKDRNGEEIYGGDIVLDYYDGDDAFIVEWDKDTASSRLTGTDNIASVSFDNFDSDIDLEVIGNIHESHELLEEEE